MKTHARTFATLVAAMVAVAATVLVGARTTAEPIDVSRVVATPVPTPTPEPTPAPTPAPVAAPAPTPDPCPQMQNPGGSVVWIPSDDAGPWSSDATVALPSLGVDAPLVKVGVSSRTKEIVVPRNARDVAWFDQGGFPGVTNNAVLAGHIAYSGQRGSFYRLSALQPGDPVVVVVKGETWTFRVTWSCAFPWDTLEGDQIMGRTEVPSVTLVSCGGTFSRANGTHDRRIVVRAELVERTETA